MRACGEVEQKRRAVGERERETIRSNYTRSDSFPISSFTRCIVADWAPSINHPLMSHHAARQHIIDVSIVDGWDGCPLATCMDLTDSERPTDVKILYDQKDPHLSSFYPISCIVYYRKFIFFKLFSLSIHFHFNCHFVIYGIFLIIIQFSLSWIKLYISFN